MVAQRVVPMNKNALATVLGAILMYVMIQVSKKVPALKEWNLTIAIVVAMVITALI
jgi:ABC-type transport system involved in cytochrome c biogenesis permease subunit